MGRKLIWRAVASAPGHEEVHVFVDASDRAEAKKHLYQRLAEEWRCSVNRITFHNMWNENELREMSTGPREPAGLPLLESGGGNGGVFMTMSRCSLLPPASPRITRNCTHRTAEVDGVRGLWLFRGTG